MAYKYIRRYGPYPTEHVFVPDPYRAKIDLYLRAITTVAGGFPSVPVFCYLLHNPNGIPYTAQNIERFHRLAEAISYTGAIFERRSVPTTTDRVDDAAVVRDKEEVLS